MRELVKSRGNFQYEVDIYTKKGTLYMLLILADNLESAKSKVSRLPIKKKEIKKVLYHRIPKTESAKRRRAVLMHADFQDKPLSEFRPKPR